jgi:hypothetical protein
MDRKVFEKIHESGTTTFALLMEFVNKLIDIDEALVNQFDSDSKRNVETSGVATDPSYKLHKCPSEVLMADGRRPSTQRRRVQRGARKPLFDPRGGNSYRL